jgi:hypothetical protein
LTRHDPICLVLSIELLQFYYSQVFDPSFACFQARVQQDVNAQNKEGKEELRLRWRLRALPLFAYREMKE